MAAYGVRASVTQTCFVDAQLQASLNIVLTAFSKRKQPATGASSCSFQGDIGQVHCWYCCCGARGADRGKVTGGTLIALHTSWTKHKEVSMWWKICTSYLWRVMLPYIWWLSVSGSVNSVCHMAWNWFRTNCSPTPAFILNRNAVLQTQHFNACHTTPLSVVFDSVTLHLYSI